MITETRELFREHWLEWTIHGIYAGAIGAVIAIGLAGALGLLGGVPLIHATIALLIVALLAGVLLATKRLRRRRAERGQQRLMKAYGSLSSEHRTAISAMSGLSSRQVSDEEAVEALRALVAAEDSLK